LLAVCPGCRSTYSVRDEKIPAQGAQIRCPKCQTAFVVKRADAPAPADPDRHTPTPGPMSAARAASLEEQLFDDMSLPETPVETPRRKAQPASKEMPALNSSGGLVAGKGKEAAPEAAWHVRTDSGETHRFESLALLQSWLHDKADIAGYQVSRDNVTWRDVAALADVAKPAARPALADLGSKPLISPSIPVPPPGAPGSLAGKSPVSRLKKIMPKRRASRVAFLFGFVVVVVGAAHGLHFADIADLSSVFSWLEPPPPKDEPRPTASRATGDDSKRPKRATTIADGGSDKSANAADAGELSGGSFGRPWPDAGVSNRTSPPELPIPKDPHVAFEAAKKLAEIKQWSDVARFLEFAKGTIHNNRGLLKLLAKAFEETGRKKEAARINEKFRRQDLLDRANRFLKSNPRRALVEFRELQEAYKNWAEPYLGEARAQKALGNEEAAKKAMEKYRRLR
jgi:predicted Zn finger-like uncharacterized protein